MSHQANFFAAYFDRHFGLTQDPETKISKELMIRMQQVMLQFISTPMLTCSGQYYTE